jgi:Zn-dependent M16 (insulinase) family peptidase
MNGLRANTGKKWPVSSPIVACNSWFLDPMTHSHGFDLLKEQRVTEINTLVRWFRHQLTGAELLSLENDDENKVFAITFRTPLSDFTGVAHIMEHSVLCGSQKYPVKEPFVELMKGSLNTFLNAFTFPDKTCYPVASQNLQDFYNLIDVYIDAVFHPLNSPQTLQQEGWHYELDSIESPLIYKGVVFNEMKGAYSNPDDLLQERAMQSIFPQGSYRFSVGGDPRFIPDLTYEQFKAFHANFYHPSNARLFFYGNDNAEERLRRMDGYLAGAVSQQPISIPQGIVRASPDTTIVLQSRFDKPQRLVFPYDPGDEISGDLPDHEKLKDGSQPGILRRKGMLVMNWLLAETGDPQEMLGLVILSHILTGTPASPLRKALIDSSLGEDMAGVGLDGDIRQAYFSIGLKGIATHPDGSLAEGDKVERLILQTMQELVEHGVDPDTVSASLNTIEFQYRENNTGSFPRGLNLMLRSLANWLYDCNPIAPLAFEAPLSAIKERVASGEQVFEDMIRSYFLENHHRTTVVMQPDPGLSRREDAAEKERLADIRSSMSREELAAVLENSRCLKELQETPDSPEALAAIPCLKREDLDRENNRIPVEISEIAGCKLLYHDLFTNGIVYFDLGFDLYTLTQEYLPYVPLFGRALLEMGTEKEDFVKLSQRIGRTTGGIFPASFTSMIFPAGASTMHSPSRYSRRGTAWLFLRGKSTVPRIDELLSILEDVFSTVRLDNPERFRQMLLEEKAGRESMLIPSGHRVVNTRLRSFFNEADWAEEQMGGISSLFFLRDLIREVEDDWASVLKKLETIRRILLNRKSMICNLTLDARSFERVQLRLMKFLQDLPSASPRRKSWRPSVSSRYEGLTIPAQVNYVGKGADLYRFGYRADGSIHVIAKYLSATFLWERVRVKGGAYGGFCLFNHRSGVLTYLSYRDPNLLGTVQNYDQVAHFLRGMDLSKEELTRAIIGAIGDMDVYQLPDAKGYTSLQRYLVGETDQTRQRWREQVLSTTLEDFHSLGNVLEQVNDKGSVVALGSPEAIQIANSERGDWLEVKKIL